jgi:hypothetical protein
MGPATLPRFIELQIIAFIQVMTVVSRSRSRGRDVVHAAPAAAGDVKAVRLAGRCEESLAGRVVFDRDGQTADLGVAFDAQRLVVHDRNLLARKILDQAVVDELTERCRHGDRSELLGAHRSDDRPHIRYGRKPGSLRKPILELLVEAVLARHHRRHAGLEDHVDIETRQLPGRTLRAPDGLFHIVVRQLLDGQRDGRDVDAVRHHLIPFTDRARGNRRRKDHPDVQAPAGYAHRHIDCSCCGLRRACKLLTAESRCRWP